MDPTTSDEEEFEEWNRVNCNVLANAMVHSGEYILLSKPGEYPVLGIAK